MSIIGAAFFGFLAFFVVAFTRGILVRLERRSNGDKDNTDYDLREELDQLDQDVLPLGCNSQTDVMQYHYDYYNDSQTE